MECRESKRQSRCRDGTSSDLAEERAGIAADPFALAGGLVLLVALGRIAAHAFPSLGHGIAMIVIFLAVIWCAVGLFIIAGELLTKRTESDGDDKGI